MNPNGRYVLLATDGVPTCGADPQQPTVAESVAAISSLRDAGIPTFVLGFSSSITVDPATLQAMADSGGTGIFYLANSSHELDAALDQIAGTIVSTPSCTYALAAVPEDPSRMLITVDGATVPRTLTHLDGWDYDAASNTITFYGSACDALQSADTEVHVDYGCTPGPVID